MKSNQWAMNIKNRKVSLCITLINTTGAKNETRLLFLFPQNKNLLVALYGKYRIMVHLFYKSFLWNERLLKEPVNL